VPVSSLSSQPLCVCFALKLLDGFSFPYLKRSWTSIVQAVADTVASLGGFSFFLAACMLPTNYGIVADVDLDGLIVRLFGAALFAVSGSCVMVTHFVLDSDIFYDESGLY
jgi:hypothetical protein